MDLTVGVLGSVTRVQSNALVPAVHVTGLSFIGAQYRGWGAYLAPELGSGGGYSSTLLGGGLSRDLLDVHLLRVTALAGYTTYSLTPTDTTGTPLPAALSLRGPSFGGMASIPLSGPVRLAYRGQYIMLQLNGTATHVIRHSVGVLF
jgi:hypothetical protein